MGGSARPLLAQAVAGEAGVIRLFSTARDEEYGQLITACQDLQHDIGSSAAAGRRTIADLNLADRHFARLAGRYTEVTARMRSAPTRHTQPASRWPGSRGHPG
jgi:hypothetical protein